MDRVIIRLAVYLTRFAGAVAAVWGVAYAINGATQAGGPVAVHVIRTGPLTLGGLTLPQGVVPRGELSLDVWGSTVAEQVLTRAGTLLNGLCLGIATLLLPALLASVLAGEPFRRGNPARIGCLAVLAAVAGLGPLLTWLGTAAVLDRAELAGAFRPAAGMPWPAFAGACFLLALALAFRRHSIRRAVRHGGVTVPPDALTGRRDALPRPGTRRHGRRRRRRQEDRHRRVRQGG